MQISLNCPINPVSFGNVSFNLLKEFYNQGSDVNLFPIGNINHSAFSLDQNIADKINNSLNNQLSFSRKNPSLKLWHISGLLESFGDKRVAFTFHETSELTPLETKILEQQDLVIVTSSYTKKVFEEAGLKNVKYIPLGFDSHHFKKVNTHKIDAITFGLFGKLEDRKNTIRIMRNWAEVFGNKKEFRLNCCVSNPFIEENQQKQMILQGLNGKVPWNINFIPFQEKLVDYNLVLNSIDIDLTAMSSCEGFNLPAFQSLCLGKVSVMLDAHAHQDYKGEACVLVQPKGMRDAVDNIFFHKGANVNQGQWHDFNDDDLKNAMLFAAENLQQISRQDKLMCEKFTYENTVKLITKEIGKI